MDARKYDGIKYVSAGQFDTEQRQRLEAFTASVTLIRDVMVEDHILVADFIVTGRRP